MLYPNQQLAVDLALKKKNIFITGKAGTGKSYVINKIVEELTNKGKNVVKLATTGSAAVLIEGQTLHSFFTLKPDLSSVDKSIAALTVSLTKARLLKLALILPHRKWAPSK